MRNLSMVGTLLIAMGIGCLFPGQMADTVRPAPSGVVQADLLPSDRDLPTGLPLASAALIAAGFSVVLFSWRVNRAGIAKS